MWRKVLKKIHYTHWIKYWKKNYQNLKSGALTGPSHAEEVSIGIPTAIVIASKEKDVLSNIQQTFANENLRVYTLNDLRGAELGGALNGIIAFCAGILVGLDMGDNTFAALTTRGLAEMAKLSAKMGGEPTTIYGLTRTPETL